MLIVQVAVALAAAVCASATAKPNANIFFLLTDDQDVILGGLEPMAQVKKVCASVCIWGFYAPAFASESAECHDRVQQQAASVGGCVDAQRLRVHTPIHHTTTANTLMNVHTFAPLAASDR